MNTLGCVYNAQHVMHIDYKYYSDVLQYDRCLIIISTLV